MRTIYLIIVLLALCVSPASVSQTMKCAPVSQKEAKHKMDIHPVALDNSNGSEVTRITFDLVSAPHTSSRIDSISAIINGVATNAIDIDGVDFNRYFQWEDDGIIRIEVDFPYRNKFTGADKIVFHTVHGDYTTIVNLNKLSKPTRK